VSVFGHETVRVRGATKRFFRTERGGVETVDALQYVSLTVHRGELVALAGQTGCGKTTLLRALMGLERIDAGTIEVNGRPVDGPGPDRAMVFQHAELLPWRSAMGNVELGLEARGVPARERRRIAREYLELVGLGQAAQRKPYELSGGMRQRVGMARALAIEPEVLLMDEPFSSLDAQTREALQQEVLRIHAHRRQTIIFVTHDLDEAVLLADRVVMMAPNPGRVHEIVRVDIPRPRTDPEAIRGSDVFVETRARLWRLLQSATGTGPPERPEGG
jgi:NitT/TauT family transport system ATP-binding protein